MTLYNRGAYAERRAMKALALAGFLVIRSAGSKGAFDLVAISSTEILLIQVKSHGARLTSRERVRMRDAVRGIPSNAHVEVWTYSPSGALEVVRYKRDG